MKFEDLPKVRGIRIDTDALVRLAHTCNPERCEWASSCCGTYEVPVDKREVSAVVGTMGHASRYAKGLHNGGGYVDPVDDTDEGLCLATDGNGTCVFAYGAGKAPVLCSLHTSALDLGIAPERVKPKACSLWPLFLNEGHPPVLTVQDDALSFPCNSRRRGRSAGLHRGVTDILRGVFGEVFFQGVQRAVLDAQETWDEKNR